MGSVPFEELEIYHLAEKISDEVWRVVLSWDNFAKDTVGKQLVRAADSISSFQKWREEIILTEAMPTVFADIGYGVLDTAMVETAAYCLVKCRGDYSIPSGELP